MQMEQIYSKEYDQCDRFVERVLLCCLGFFWFIYILNLLDIFIVEQSPFDFLLVVSSVLFSLPVWLFRLPLQNRRAVRFAVNILLAVAITILYAFLTFHVLFLFLLPIMLFSIYGNKRFSVFTYVLTLVSMTVAHVLSYWCSVIPEEPFTTMYTILLYGLLPRILVFTALFYAQAYITNHNRNMVQKVYAYSRDMFQTQEEVVRAFAEICESKSGQTGQHIKRVSVYVDMMAEELGISGQERESLVIAAMVHDVGKLKIPDEILEKPGKLTDEEFAVIKQHVHIGYDLLKNAPGRVMEIGAKIALQHHEKWNGKGYLGIAGEDIDFYARIMAIADVYDALTSRRSYKEAWSAQDAYDEIVSQSGQQFDPALVTVFQKCYPKMCAAAQRLPDTPRQA